MHLTQMPAQVRLHREPLRTQPALVRLLPRMRPHVHLQVGSRPKRLVAHLAEIVLLAGVQLRVQTQRVLAGKLLVAELALEAVIIGRRVLGRDVVVEVGLLAEPQFTLGAVVGPLLQVNAQVDGERGLGEEHLVAVLAAYRAAGV